MRTFLWNTIVSLALIISSQTATPAQARRVALVVGNSTYLNVPQLDNPRNDARLIADTLRDLGFTLVGGGPQLDLDKASFDTAVQKFGAQLRDAEVGLFYYAGHGVQVRGSNYLVPVGANPTREADVDFQMVDINLVLRQMEGSGTKLNLVLLDACRNNPFGGRGLRATGGGLAQMQAPEGTLISYATQPGNVAQDGADGNSPYSKALAQTIRQGGLDIFGTFNAIGLAVKRSTGGSQQPWLSSSPIEGTFYFASAPPGASATTVIPPVSTANTLPQPATPQLPGVARPPAPAAVAALPNAVAPAIPPDTVKRTDVQMECSAQADTKGLHGKERKKFRSECIALGGREKIVFPRTVPPQYSGEEPGKARMHTCVDQYNANKATNANGGMKWIEVGGGYYNECTRRLKG